MLTNIEKQQIRGLLQSPQWQAAERLAGLVCDKISYEPVVRDTEWETLKNALVNEGKVQGIKDFLKELYNQAQHDG